MKNTDTLYHLSNLFSFLGMLLLLLDALQLFDGIAWFNVDVPFWILMGIMLLLQLQAKRINPRQMNPNMIVPTSKYAYFIGIGAFTIGYILLQEDSIGQVACYAIAVACEVISTVSTFLVISKMKSKS